MRVSAAFFFILSPNACCLAIASPAGNLRFVRAQKYGNLRDCQTDFYNFWKITSVFVFPHERQAADFLLNSFVVHRSASAISIISGGIWSWLVRESSAATSKGKISGLCPV